MFAGTCGNGKTTLMNAIQSATNWLTQRRGFGQDEYGNDIKMTVKIVHVKDIIARCKDYNEMELLKKTEYLGIDDMGTEPTEVMDHGNIRTRDRIQKINLFIAFLIINPCKFKYIAPTDKIYDGR